MKAKSEDRIGMEFWLCKSQNVAKMLKQDIDFEISKIKSLRKWI